MVDGQYSTNLQGCAFLVGTPSLLRSNIEQLASKKKEVCVATIHSIVSNEKYMDELAFFGTNGKPCLVTDHPLDNAYPFEVSQVESVGILLILMTLWLKALALRWIHHSMLIWPDSAEDDSVSVGVE